MTNGIAEKQSCKYALDELRLQHTLVSELPQDPQRENFVRTVKRSVYSLVEPTFLSETEGHPRVVAWSENAAELIDLQEGQKDNSLTAEVFGGFCLLPPSVGFTYAQCYGGHQFGSWAGQLGDGRAICLGEYVNERGERWDIQLKGAGKTPYGRFADGYAVLRSCLREFVASEALASLGIPTTRALCVVETGKDVPRDMFYDGNWKLERGAVVTRLAPSFIRIGTFELFANAGDFETLRKLAEYCIKHYFSEFSDKSSVFSDDNNRYVLMAKQVIRRNAEMVAKWQAFGFVHGVMNTDNFSILGLTLDYGPFGFLDKYDPLYTPNSTDLPGRRYCYINQPQVAKWNCQKFAQALISLYGAASVFDVMEEFDKAYQATLSACYRDKLGLLTWNESSDMMLVESLLDLIQTDNLDYTNIGECNVPFEQMFKQARQLDSTRKEAWNKWFVRYISRLKEENNTNDLDRQERMNSVNPCYILRNYYLFRAIQQAEQGDFSGVDTLLQIFSKPYEERPEYESFTEEPPDWSNIIGVCVNSCSS
eukprot:jgi/Galph1/4726/GphlegSOOS_G3389.1